MSGSALGKGPGRWYRRAGGSVDRVQPCHQAARVQIVSATAFLPSSASGGCAYCLPLAVTERIKCRTRVGIIGRGLEGLPVLPFRYWQLWVWSSQLPPDPGGALPVLSSDARPWWELTHAQPFSSSVQPCSQGRVGQFSGRTMKPPLSRTLCSFPSLTSCEISFLGCKPLSCAYLLNCSWQGEQGHFIPIVFPFYGPRFVMFSYMFSLILTT